MNVRLYAFDMSVNDITYDKEDVITALTFMDEMLEEYKLDPQDKQCYEYCKDEIMRTVNYLLSRLQHSEAERFK